jgi:hypothetical protein
MYTVVCTDQAHTATLAHTHSTREITRRTHILNYILGADAALGDAGPSGFLSLLSACRPTPPTERYSDRDVQIGLRRLRPARSIR